MLFGCVPLHLAVGCMASRPQLHFPQHGRAFVNESPGWTRADKDRIGDWDQLEILGTFWTDWDRFVTQQCFRERSSHAAEQSDEARVVL
jgi:hypothetical protein